MKYFKFFYGLGIICLSLNIPEISPRKPRRGRDSLPLSSLIPTHHKEQHLLFKQTGTTTMFSFGYQSCVLPRSDPFFRQNPCSGCNNGIVLVVALEYTFFQLFSDAKQISVRLAGLRRSYVKCPAVVLTSHTSYTAFLFDLRCAVQSGYVPNFCSCSSPMIVYLRNLYLFLLLECC